MEMELIFTYHMTMLYFIFLTNLLWKIENETCT